MVVLNVVHAVMIISGKSTTIMGYVVENNLMLVIVRIFWEEFQH